MARTLKYFPVKMGFRSDREFHRLMVLCEGDEVLFWACVGFWLGMLEEAHRMDRLDPPDDVPETSGLVQRLQLAGLLGSNGAIPKATFDKWRVPYLRSSAAVLGGLARAAAARRTDRGTFAAGWSDPGPVRSGPANDQPPAKEEGERTTIEQGDQRKQTTSRVRKKSAPTHIGDVIRGAE